jgi:hypothetical protein
MASTIFVRYVIVFRLFVILVLGVIVIVDLQFQSLASVVDRSHGGDGLQVLLQCRIEFLNAQFSDVLIESNVRRQAQQCQATGKGQAELSSQRGWAFGHQCEVSVKGEPLARNHYEFLTVWRNVRYWLSILRSEWSEFRDSYACTLCRRFQALAKLRRQGVETCGLCHRRGFRW